MAYIKLGWVNNRAPALNQSNLNHMDQGIYEAHQKLSEYEDIFTGDVDESVQNWLDEHPEATTTVEDGSITKPKLTESLIEFLQTKDKQNNSFRFNLDSGPSVLTRKQIKEGVSSFSGSADYKYLQGACANPAGNKIFIVVPKTDYSDCKIIELSVTSIDGTYTKVQEATFNNLGHGNDMTYNTKTDKLCVINENKIVVIDPVTLVTESEHTIEQNMTCIAYDETNNVFYCHYAMSTLMVIDADDYSTVAVYSTDIENRVTFSTQMLVGQGGFMYKDYFVRIYVKTPLTDKVGYQTHYLVCLRKDSGLIDYVITFWAENGGTEIETGWSSGNDMILVAGGNAFTVFSINTDTENLKRLRSSYYYGYDRLANDSDLGNRTIQGHWVTRNDTDTQSLHSKPTNGSLSGSVSVDVRQHGMYNIRQILSDEANEVFTRLWRGSDNGWTTWARLLSDQNVTITTSSGLQLIDIKPLKTYILFGNYSAQNITWSNMTLTGKMSKQFVVSLPSGYTISAYAASGASSGSGKTVSVEGINSSGLVFRILTFHDEPTSANVKIFLIATYS